MKIHGFQKMTLLDFPGKVACTVFTGGCNLRCPFCHNASLVTEIDGESEIKEAEILDFLSKRNGLLDGVAITGGEPLLQNDIVDFIRKIKELGFAVKLDTNGTFPDKLKYLVNSKLVDYVAMDIKNSPSKYAITSGLKEFDFSCIKESIDFLLEGNVDFEFRTTVVKEFHQIDDFAEIGKLISGAPKYFLQNFVDSGNLIGENLHSVPKEEIEKAKEILSSFIKNVEIRGL
ncbi:MAG: anaerobic ribonucleoside-triphosphate reductase activating protein [Clostridia bacterium]|nr:anaerobic ribonucleoside-triphosphate reductase activating protein [Clostridia bacterium]